MSAAQLMAVPALGALALGAGAVVASVGSLVLPFYAGYKLHKRLERRRSAKRRRRAREAMWRKLEDMRWRGLLYKPTVLYLSHSTVSAKPLCFWAVHSPHSFFCPFVHPDRFGYHDIL